MIELDGQKLRVKIKPGIPDGQILKIKEKGGAGANGGAPGDLFITIKVEPHSKFERKEDDLYLNQEVDLFKAVLG
ncbi:MAG: J domain-containing protein, partial [Bacteroidota bacterium]|nr:J domain-containing protein [Bacteroidota bacterium]